MRITRKLMTVLLVLFLLSGCGGSGGSGGKPTDRPDTHYEIPEFLSVEYDESAGDSSNGTCLDISHSAQGYFGIRSKSDARLKLQVLKDDLVYTYDIPNDYTTVFFPFQSGNGRYVIRVMENVRDSKYREVYRKEVKVKLADEFQPFRRPSMYVNYDASSKCVQLAHTMAEKAADANDFISMVYSHIVKNVRYDKKKAKTVASGYCPDPDETLSTKKGICFDYASLACAMLRSQGIPAKLIFGYVAPDDLYHAWNMIYTSESGWITVEFNVSSNVWNRVDLTFSAGGSDLKFIRDDGNYAELYQY